jgi:hypothetical protein
MRQIGVGMVKASALLISFVAIASLASCVETIIEPCPLAADGATCATAITNVTDARARWNAARPASYEYTLAVGCFCLRDVTRPVVITVTATTVTSRRYEDDGTAVPDQLAATFPSIDGLFDKLLDARMRNAANSAANYEPTLGYPVQISLDYSATIADDEISYVVSRFRAR